MLMMKGTPDAPKCGFSRKIVETLREASISFASFNILEDEEVRQGLKKYSNWPTYPQLYVEGKLLGGLDVVKELQEEEDEPEEDEDSDSAAEAVYDLEAVPLGPVEPGPAA